MKIKAPINGYVNKDYPQGNVTQWFGENHDLYFSRMGMEGHNGIDIVAPWGTDILAVEDGIVVDTKDTPEGYGKHIRIVTDIEGVNREWTYGHLSFLHCEIGDIVKAGDCIGQMGNTGFVVSSPNANGFWEFNPYGGTHLHLGLRLFEYSKKGWSYYPDQKRMKTLDYLNGYKGSIDFKDMLPDQEIDLNQLKADLDKQGFTEMWQKVVFVLKWLGFK